MGSRFSTLGEARRSSALEEGDPVLKEFETAEMGVGKGAPTFGDRRISNPLMGVFPLGVAVAGVCS